MLGTQSTNSNLSLCRGLNEGQRMLRLKDERQQSCRTWQLKQGPGGVGPISVTIYRKRDRTIYIYINKNKQAMLSSRFDPSNNSRLYSSTVTETRKPSTSMYQKRTSGFQPQAPFTSNYLSTNYQPSAQQTSKYDQMLRAADFTARQTERLALHSNNDFLSKSQAYTGEGQSKSSQKYEGWGSERQRSDQRGNSFVSKAEVGENKREQPTVTSENMDNYSILLDKLSKKQKIIKELQKLCETKVSDNIRSHAYEKDTVEVYSPVRSKRYTVNRGKPPNNTTDIRNTLETPTTFNIDLTRSSNYDSYGVGSYRNDKDKFVGVRKGSEFIPTKGNPEDQLLSKDYFRQVHSSRNTTTKQSYRPSNDSGKVESIEKAKDKITSNGNQDIRPNNDFYSSNYNASSHKSPSVRGNSFESYGPVRKRDQDRDQKYLKDVRKMVGTKNVGNNAQYFKNRKVSLSEFDLKKSLGQGKFGVVYQAFHRQTNSLYALKKISKKVIRSNLMIDQLLQQIKIQSYCNHQNILKVYGFFDDTEHIYLILEYMEEGTLFSQLKMKKTFTQEETAAKLKDIVKAVIYLHQNGIAHRDIKPQNIVMSNGVSKLCDFGWAAICTDRRKTYCGTFDYVAPEILQGSEYDATVDLWCLGVLAYELLVGKAPFYHISRKQTMKKILNVQKLQYPASVSHEAISFIEGLLKKNPQQRMHGANILKHPFLARETDPLL